MFEQIREYFGEFFSASAELPFSMLADGVPLSELAAQGRVELERQKDGFCLLFADGLALSVRIRQTPALSGLEYSLRLKNTGEGLSARISGWQSADFLFAPSVQPGEEERPDEGHFFDWQQIPPFSVLTVGGAYSDPSDFALRETSLDRGMQLSLRAGGGRSSSANMPYFRAVQGKAGLIAAIGWAGEWKASFEARTRRRLRIRLGMERTNFRLLPGEEVCGPSILLCRETEGDLERLHNRFRRLVTGGEGEPLLFCNTCFTRKGEWLNETNEENQISLIRALAPYGVSAVITDAGWFEGGWPDGAGNWMQPKKAAYPDGFAPVSAAAEQCGLRYGLWFEPERIMAGTRLSGEIPQLCLRLRKERRGSPETMLADFGKAETREFFLAIIGHYVKQHGIRAYRQDFNVEPLAFWRDNDEPEREGIREMRYVAGLYAFWDELRARYPDLLLDGCASGGRRLDFETLRRFDVHQKSDYWFDPVTDQNALFALNLFLPAGKVTAHLDTVDPYAFFSAAAAALCLGWRADSPEFDGKNARKIAEWYRELSPLLSGDYYPLTPLESQQNPELAMEFFRSDLQKGVILFFRRGPSPDAGTPLRSWGMAALIRAGCTAEAHAIHENKTFSPVNDEWRCPAGLSWETLFYTKKL